MRRSHPEEQHYQNPTVMIRSVARNAVALSRGERAIRRVVPSAWCPTIIKAAEAGSRAPTSLGLHRLGCVRWHGGPSVAADAPTVSLTFLQPDDTKKAVTAKVGESLLQVAHRNDIDLEGACEGKKQAKLNESCSCMKKAACRSFRSFSVVVLSCCDL